MDLREKRTLRHIRDAFLRLRANKPLERITVKELSELAEISKATFYLHYKDIYDLSEQLQDEVIQRILDNITHPEQLIPDPTRYTQKLLETFSANQSLMEILFSGNQAAVLPIQIGQKVKEYLFQAFPEAREDPRFNILLTYHIQGGYYTYMENYKRFGNESILETMCEIAKKLPLQPE